MQLNQATDYALRAVMYLADSFPKEIVPAQIIAESEEIPTRFLLKIMRSLIKAGIVKSYRGTDGGYGLARKPEEITLLDVVEAMEGPVVINRCLLNPKYCNKDEAGICEIHEALRSIQNLLVQELGSYTFGEMLSNKRRKLKQEENE